MEANALVGRMVNIGGVVTKVTANTASQLTVEDNVTAAENSVIYPVRAARMAGTCTPPW